MRRIVHNISGGDKAQADAAVREALWGRGPLNVQNTKICCGFFWIGFRSDRMHYSESLLLYLGVNSPIKWGEGDLPTGQLHLCYAQAFSNGILKFLLSVGIQVFFYYIDKYRVYFRLKICLPIEKYFGQKT